MQEEFLEIRKCFIIMYFYFSGLKRMIDILEKIATKTNIFIYTDFFFCKQNSLPKQNKQKCLSFDLIY